LTHVSTAFVATEDHKNSEPHAPNLAADDDHECPVRADDDVGVVTSSRRGCTSPGVWAATAEAGDGVTVHRCRSDDTLSSVSVRRAGDHREEAAVDRPSRRRIQSRRPPLSGRQRVFVEINRRQREDSGDILSVSPHLDNSSQHQRRTRTERPFFVVV